MRKLGLGFHSILELSGKKWEKTTNKIIWLLLSEKNIGFFRSAPKTTMHSKKAWIAFPPFSDILYFFIRCLKNWFPFSAFIAHKALAIFAFVAFLCSVNQAGTLFIFKVNSIHWWSHSKYFFHICNEMAYNQRAVLSTVGFVEKLFTILHPLENDANSFSVVADSKRCSESSCK